MILSVAEGIILLGGEDVLSRFDIVPRLFVSAGGRQLSRGCIVESAGRDGMHILIRFLGLGILLALRRWNLAFNRKRYTVGAGHTKTGSIAADLFSGGGRTSANATGKSNDHGGRLTFRAWQVYAADKAQVSHMKSKGI